MEEKMLLSGKQIPAKTMKPRNSVQKEVTNQHSDRSMIKETHRWPIKSFAFNKQMKCAPWMAQLMA